jgi:hypothetical protein
MVHPADLGNVAEGYPGLASQTFNDPTPPGIGSTQLDAWRGGCGREPLTATSSPGPGVAANPSGKTCADGTTTCNGEPWGSWGYDVNSGLGYTHTFAKLSDIKQICVNMYDVHGGDKVGGAKFQIPNNSDEITVDKSGDNSIVTNAYNPTFGVDCVGVAQLSTAIHNAAHTTVTSVVAGTPVHDFVTAVSPAGVTPVVTPTGSVTVDWFNNATCTGAPVSTSSSAALSGSSGTSTADVTGFVQTPSTAGTYSFLAHYPGGLRTAQRCRREHQHQPDDRDERRRPAAHLHRHGPGEHGNRIHSRARRNDRHLLGRKRPRHPHAGERCVHDERRDRHLHGDRRLHDPWRHEAARDDHALRGR